MLGLKLPYVNEMGPCNPECNLFSQITLRVWLIGSRMFIKPTAINDSLHTISPIIGSFLTQTVIHKSVKHLEQFTFSRYGETITK